MPRPQKDKTEKKRTKSVQSKLVNNEVDEFDLIKAKYGLRKDSEVVRYLVHKEAEAIKSKENISA